MIRSTWWIGDSSRSSAASAAGSPYLVIAASAIHGSVCAKNVAKSEIPQTSTPTANSSGYQASATRVR